MPETAQQPNILFFFSDQQRWDTVGAYGQRLEVTPNLDRMAAEGVLFENAFTCQPVCGPARACLQTGKYATEVGCHVNNRSLPLDEKTIAHWCSEAGYEVGYIGKWHLASDPQNNYRELPVPPERRGGWKDHWLASDVLEFTSHGYDGHMFDAAGRKVEFQGYRADCLTDFALEYLEGRQADRPWFLFLSFIEPHHQNDRNRFEGPHGSKERFAGFDVPGDLEGTEGDWREQYPDYLGCCADLDYNLGRIRARLAELSMAENTLIIYSSDHGSHFKTRNGEYKRSCHDGCLRIPMIACGPGFRGGKRVEELVSLMDLPPTFLKAAGVEVPPYMRGLPLQGLADETATEWPEEVFAQISESQVGRCIRTSRWKYSVSSPLDASHGRTWADPDSPVYMEEYLYDLENDPHERCNLIKDPVLKETRLELRAILLRRMMEAGEAEALIISPWSNSQAPRT